MNYTINLHGDRRVNIPSGLPELISDISKEVIRNKPINITFFIADYLNSKLVARDKALHATDFVDTILTDVRSELMFDYKKYGLRKEVATEAAIKIQALFKGFNTRKTLKKTNEFLIAEENGVPYKTQYTGQTSEKSDPSSDSSSKLNETYSIKYIKGSIISEGNSVMYMPPSKLQLVSESEDIEAIQDDVSIISGYPPPIRANVKLKLPRVTSPDKTTDLKTNEDEKNN